MDFEWKKLWRWLFYFFGAFIAVSICAFAFIALMYRLPGFSCFSTIIPGGIAEETTSRTLKDFAEITRNFAWLFWMFASLTGVCFGLWLAWRGRQTQDKQWKTQEKQQKTQHESHLQERYEKAADMLGNEVELTRIAACRSLMNLGKSDESMKIQCVRLLFAFINDPPLEVSDKGKDLSELFPADKPLRADIQSAIASFSAIYQHYNKDSIDNEPVELPKYFWANKKKDKISLTKANLQGAPLQGADLTEANLRGTNLKRAELKGVNLWRAGLEGANLQGAELNGANLQRAGLEGANLQGAELKGANLQRAGLEGANLQGTDLREADLQKAELEGAKLGGAELQGADLQGADLREVDLQDADISGADISGADMRQAKNLTKKQILSAIWGYDKEGDYGPPKLPKNLAQDKDVKKWLKTPAYDNRKKPEDS